MELKLFRSDLKPEYEEICVSQTDYHHFNTKAQAAISLIGRATFWHKPGTRLESWNTIYAKSRNPPNADGNETWHVYLPHEEYCGHEQYWTGVYWSDIEIKTKYYTDKTEAESVLEELRAKGFNCQIMKGKLSDAKSRA